MKHVWFLLNSRDWLAKYLILWKFNSGNESKYKPKGFNYSSFHLSLWNVCSWKLCSEIIHVTIYFSHMLIMQDKVKLFGCIFFSLARFLKSIWLHHIMLDCQWISQKAEIHPNLYPKKKRSEIQKNK